MTILMTADKGAAIEWRDWSVEAFEEAKARNKLVLLDLTASWCHWCHVMDSTTYSDPQVVGRINESFVPVRVDIDKRPDISERYNRGGFPTTAFLSERGESIWGATYIPPVEMKRVIDAVVRAKANGSIDGALAKERASCETDRSAPKKGRGFAHEDYGIMLEDVLAQYDAEFGGFGTEPKFPHPDCIELMLLEYGERADSAHADAVRRTLLGMADGLYDFVEGGMFRYSVSRDWKVPHYEKMLETNAAFLLNLVQADAILDDKRFSELADGVAGYMLSTLRDAGSRCFFGSQDADEAYYRARGSDREDKKKPSVDMTIYAGWNFEAVRAFSEAGKLLGRPDWIEVGRSSMMSAASELWDAEKGLFRHTPGQDLYLFEDQVSFLLAVVSVLELYDDPNLRRTADLLIESVRQRFPHPEGGYRDVLSTGDSIGELEVPLRSLIWNSKWASAMALYGFATDQLNLVDAASEVLAVFGKREVEAYGIFASSYLTAWKLLARGPLKVEVHAKMSDAHPPALWSTAKALFPIDAVIILEQDEVDDGDGRPFAVVCGRAGCSSKIFDRELLRRTVSNVRGSQA